MCNLQCSSQWEGKGKLSCIEFLKKLLTVSFNLFNTCVRKKRGHTHINAVLCARIVQNVTKHGGMSPIEIDR